MWEVGWIIFSFLIYLVDQGTDALTSLLLILEGHILEGCLTGFLITLPGIIAFSMELRQMWRGKGNLLKALIYLILCPVWAILTHLYSIHNSQWRSKALLLKTMEGFLCSSPQLILQMSLWFRGILTGPLEMVLVDTGLNLTSVQYQQNNMTVFGRNYDKEERYWFGVVQLSSILISFISVFTSVIYFNELEKRNRSTKSSSIGKFILAIPFFCLTIIYRSVGLSLIVCFLRWWSAVIIFLMFFFTLLTSLSIGDRFGRSCVYGVWSFLAPVGYSRDPVAPLGYYPITHVEEDLVEEVNMIEIVKGRQRSSYFLTSPLLASLFLMGPSLIVTIILVNRATVPGSSLDISTEAIFPLSSLYTTILPCLALCLAFSLLLVRPYHRADRVEGEKIEGNIIV